MLKQILKIRFLIKQYSNMSLLFYNHLLNRILKFFPNSFNSSYIARGNVNPVNICFSTFSCSISPGIYTLSNPSACLLVNVCSIRLSICCLNVSISIKISTWIAINRWPSRCGSLSSYILRITLPNRAPVKTPDNISVPYQFKPILEKPYFIYITQNS